MRRGGGTISAITSDINFICKKKIIKCRKMHRKYVKNDVTIVIRSDNWRGGAQKVMIG